MVDSDDNPSTVLTQTLTAFTPASAGEPVRPWMSMSKPYWTRLNIARFETSYSAKYIGDFCIKDADGRWTEFPVAVFYCATPDLSKGHKHYVGAFLRAQGVFVCDASIVAGVAWNGAIAESGEIMISTYRHDYRESADRTAMVDGGQDYCRMQGMPVQVWIDGPALAASRLAIEANSPPANPQKALPGEK